MNNLTEKHATGKVTAVYDDIGQLVDNILENCQTTLPEVISLIKDIDITKSSSVAYLSSNVLKDAFTVLPHVLLKIFNLSLESGIVPDSWKRGTIIPLK